MTFVPNYEERYYQVHPSQLPWAMHQLRSIPGFQIHHYEIGANGMAVILVYAPIGAPDTDWRAPVQQRRRWPRLNLPRLARGAALALIAIALAYIAYAILAGGALEMPAQGVTVPTTPPEMPWDAVGRQVSEAVDSATRILTTLVALLVALLVAWALLKVRGVWKAFRK